MSEGGLGFRNLKDFNVALLTKQLWRILSNINLVVSKRLYGKYNIHGFNDLFVDNWKALASYTWRSLMTIVNLVKGTIRFRVGSGAKIDT